MKGVDSQVVLKHLTDAARSLQTAYDLAKAAGADDAAAIMRRAVVIAGSAISAVVSPLEHRPEVVS